SFARGAAVPVGAAPRAALERGSDLAKGLLRSAFRRASFARGAHATAVPRATLTRRGLRTLISQAVRRKLRHGRNYAAVSRLGDGGSVPVEGAAVDSASKGGSAEGYRGPQVCKIVGI